MKIGDMRVIGGRLFAELGATRLRPFSSEAIGKGAGGDKTYGIDKAAEDIVIAGIEALKEPLRIVSEELGVRDLLGGGPQVLIDPIDGSRNAVNGIPFYCTSIAVCEGGTFGDIALGYVINLLTGDEFWAEKGKGAFFNGERISSQADNIFYLAAYETQVPGGDLPKIVRLMSEARKTRCWGSTALDLALLAYGAVSVFIAPSASRSFDFAAGYLLVKESGGVITDTSGNSLDDKAAGLHTRTPLLASGNRNLHEAALKLLNG
ncbi:MAG TPA: inositol monophosphatase family protein [Dissulfurispiraceae bacterium]|nr:inositol monophosphatase family protein [Dissulfurispiraceae bacterium]